ncbi:MAG: hypothetical protein RBT71_11990, partial [Flavobacteriales bacterium]|nr:hypothetical protein [Flavobacteriales bacterium]
QSTTDLTVRGSRTELLGFTFGAPFRQGKWGMAIGLAPVSRVGYDMSVPHRTDDGRDVTLRYNGSGGLARAFAGLARTVWHRPDSLDNGGRLAIGAQVNYLFGRVEEGRRVYYPTGLGYYHSSVVGSLLLRDPAAGVGVQYRGDLVRRRSRADDGLRYMIGVAAELPARIGARRTEVASTFTTGSSGVEFPVDTALFIDGARGHLTLPLLLRFGVAVMDRRWCVSVEHQHRDWDQLVVDVEGYGLRAQLGTQSLYAIGASFRPAGDDRGTFWTRTTYRAGLRMADHYLVVNGTAINEVSATAGLSLPLMSSTTRTHLHLGAEWASTGTTDGGLLHQRSLGLYLGVSITPDLREIWFRKRRIE